MDAMVIFVSIGAIFGAWIGWVLGYLMRKDDTEEWEQKFWLERSRHEEGRLFVSIQDDHRQRGVWIGGVPLLQLVKILRRAAYLERQGRYFSFEELHDLIGRSAFSKLRQDLRQRGLLEYNNQRQRNSPMHWTPAGLAILDTISHQNIPPMDLVNEMTTKGVCMSMYAQD